MRIRAVSSEVERPLNNTARRGIRFALVGGSTFVLNVGTFWALVESGVGAGLALVFSYVLSLIAHFWGSRFFTFKGRPVSRGALLRYLLAAVLSLLIASTISRILQSFDVLPPLSGAVAITFTTAVSYLLLNKFVFKVAEGSRR